MIRPLEAADDLPWPQTLATVTSCVYQFGTLGVMAFGIPDRKHFLISFTYPAAQRAYTGQFRSPIAIAQGHTFPISWNPSDPRENTQSRQNPD